MFELMRGMREQTRLSVASALVRSGVMGQLHTPKSAQDLRQTLGIKNYDAFANLLRLSTRIRLLKLKQGKYSPRGALARSLVGPEQNPLRSMLVELSTYHVDVLRDLPELLLGSGPKDYLHEYGGMVATSSRIAEPWIFDFCRQSIGGRADSRIADLGCGSGEFLAYTSTLHAGNCGFGIELNPDAAIHARARFNRLGIADRYNIIEGDIRDASAWPNEEFDFMSAHQNVYYFDAEERVAIWKQCRAKLAASGKLLIVTPTAGGPTSDYFSLILRSTVGCTQLPKLDELIDELQSAGFSIERKERLIPGDSFWGIAASQART